MTAGAPSSEPTFTNGWALPPHEMLRTVATEFGIADTLHDGALDDVRQTGFAHTQREGVICLAMNRNYFARACANPCVRAIIAPPEVATAGSAPLDKAVVTSAHAEELYLYLHAEQVSNPSDDVFDIHSSATIDPSAIMRGHVRVGARVSIGPRVVISGPVTLHDDVQLEPGVIIGCDGLYAKIIRGHRVHMPHFGGVDIGAEAFLHAGAIIVRSALRGEVTRIGQAAHIGVMTNVGHDATIGNLAAISSNCVIAGRASVGANAWIGASAIISNAVHIGVGAKVRLGAVVIRDVPDHASVSGNFAIDHAYMLRKFLTDTSA